MTRRALTAVALAAIIAGAVTPLLAGRDSNKASYTCGTALGTVKRAEGRLTTWNLSTLSFTPDSRSARPVLIRYKSITRLEYGRTPPHWAETPETYPVTLDCTPRWTGRRLTIFYKEVPAVVDDEKPDRSRPKDRQEKDKQAREERRERLDQKELKDPKDQRKDRKAKEDLLKEKEHFAVFEIADGALRPTFRILETRSGKRINYEDAGARRAAR